MAIARIGNHEVIPEIDSQLFEGHEDSRMAVGIVAVGSQVVPGLENEFWGYSLLRGNVYARQRGYIPVEDLNPDDTESDPDDERAVHFAVVENAQPSPRIVGSLRLILKSLEHQELLPIERHYPEVSVSVPGSEASRLIGRHESPATQRLIKWMLFSAATAHIMEHDLGPAFGAVEPVLSRGLRLEGMPLTELGSARFVPEFNASKLPIRIDVPNLARRLESSTARPLRSGAGGSFVYVPPEPAPSVGRIAAAAA